MDTSNVLVIGDTHAPFTHPNYLQHCKEVKRYFKCDRVVHIGDIVDNQATSNHDPDPDGMSAGSELEIAIEELASWHRAFPHTDALIGNHCARIWKKAKSVGMSARWVKNLGDVLELPTWTFHMSLVIDGVLYIHGESVTARTRAQRERMSVVQGHRHTEGYVWFNQSKQGSIFGMQVGCGIDPDAYAFAYAKDHPAPALSCGVVLEGKLPILLPMI